MKRSLLQKQGVLPKENSPLLQVTVLRPFWIDCHCHSICSSSRYTCTLHSCAHTRARCHAPTRMKLLSAIVGSRSHGTASGETPTHVEVAWPEENPQSSEQ